MDKAGKESMRSELRPWAEIYDRIIGENPTEESIRKISAFCDLMSRGKWLSHRTEAHEVWTEREDGSKLRMLVVTKKDHYQGIEEKDTGFLWIHGGGYAIGTPEMDFMFAERFCEQDHVVMVLPDYRKSVEMPYPAALDDCMLALKWMKENASLLGINPSQLFVGGESAGGGLTCAVTQRARDEGDISIAFSMPLYPMLSEADTDSSKDNHMPVWNTAYNHLCWQIYRGSLEGTSPYFSPSAAENYSDLPPAFTIISELEPFYTETKQYFKSLYEADVPVMLKEYSGCFHAFDMVAPHTHVVEEAAELEKKVFRYAQKHFFKEQPSIIKKERPLSHEEKMMLSLNDAIKAQKKVLKEEEPEDVFSNLQKVIEDDTADSLKDIENLIDQLH